MMRLINESALLKGMGEMNIYEYADALNAKINWRYHPNQERRITCNFEDCEVMKNGCLSSEYGNGKTPIDALVDYISHLEGKRIVFDATGPARREFDVPKGFSLD